MADGAGSHVYVGAAPWTGGEVGGLFRRKVAGGPWENVTSGVVGHVQAVTIDPVDPRTVFVGTADGPWRSRDAGDSWERLPFPERDVQIWSITVHPTRPKTIFAGASPVAVYRSDDGGDSWRRLPDPQVPERARMPFACRVMRIAVDPARPDEIYATLEVNGAIRSLDGGETWDDCSEPLVALAREPHLKSRILSDTDAEGMLDGHAVCVSGAAPGSVFLAVRMGVFRSDDQGMHWRDLEVGRFSPLTYARDIRVAPQDPKTFYACLSPAARSEDGSVYRSRDLGATWERFDRGVKAESTMMGVAPHAHDPDTVFATSRTGQVFGTTDGGRTWSESRLPDCRDVYAIAVG
mgnify:CR=1 FL=1